jgi:hypothetical protein
MNKTTRWLLIVIIAAGAGAGAGVFYLSRYQAPERQAAAPKTEAPAPADEALTRHPVPETGAAAGGEPTKPLPALKDSDAALRESLDRLFDPARLGELFVLKDMINRFVVTIDNLPRAKLAQRDIPTLPPPGKFLVDSQSGAGTVIAPENYARYKEYVQFIEDTDTQKIASLYFHFYPLFQEAYSNLGYKTAYFNDRLIAAIDDLLAAPEIKDPVPLVRPSVFYKFADPRLEALSSGQKIMLRIGGDNAAKVKVKLRELRQALTKPGADK